MKLNAVFWVCHTSYGHLMTALPTITSMPTPDCCNSCSSEAFIIIAIICPLDSMTNDPVRYSFSLCFVVFGFFFVISLQQFQKSILHYIVSRCQMKNLSLSLETGFLNLSRDQLHAVSRKEKIIFITAKWT